MPFIRNVLHLLIFIRHMDDRGFLEGLKETVNIQDADEAIETLVKAGANLKLDRDQKYGIQCCAHNALDDALEFLQFSGDTGNSIKSIDSAERSILLSLLSEETRCDDDMNKVEIKSNIASFLVRHGAYFGKDQDGNGPLHIAAKTGSLATLEVLLQLCKNTIVDKNHVGDTAVHMCLKNPKENVCEIIQKLLENQTSTLSLNLKGESPLYLATVLRKLQNIKVDFSSITAQLVEALLGNGADPNDHSTHYIPLLSTLEAKDVKTSTLLLEAGANVNATNNRGMSGLHVIFMCHDKKENDHCLTHLLLEKGVKVNLIDSEGKSAMFHMVDTYMENYDRNESDIHLFNDIFNALLNHGADLNICDNSEETVLSLFCSFGKNIDIGRILLASGADPKNGYCLQNAMNICRKFENRKSWMSFMISVLQKGADPNKRKAKSSNLIELVKKRNSHIVEEFLKHGADVNYSDVMKTTALHYACDIDHFNDRYTMTALLVKYGSNLNAASINGERPLDILVQNMINDIYDLKRKEVKEEQCSFLTVDMSLLNLLVCGGADLCPATIDPIAPPKNKKLFSRPIQLQNTNRSVLFMFISNGLFKTAKYLLQSGWDVKQEEWFHDFDVSKLGNIRIYKKNEFEARKAEFQSYLENIDIGPKSLTNICRKSIRSQLLMVSNGSEIETKISALPLPPKIQCFLSLKEFMNDIENIEIK
ncbi:poly [ADP-ribose] polymerase tankyrase-1-like isoform X1 [Mytilus edulis]